MLKLVLILLLGILVPFVVAWLIAVLALTGRDHSEFDFPRDFSMATGRSESLERAAAAQEIAAGLTEPPPAKGKELLRLMCDFLDERGASAAICSDIRKVDAVGMKGEWVISPNADLSRRRKRSAELSLGELAAAGAAVLGFRGPGQ